MTYRVSRNHYIAIALLLILAVFAFVIGNNVFAQQGQQQTSDIEVRLGALEKTVDQLYTFMIVIPGLAGLLVLILQISTIWSQAQDRKITMARDQREAKSANVTDSIMGSVSRLLGFQSDQAKLLAKQTKKFDPSQGINAIFDKVKDLRNSVKRYNLYTYHDEIVDLSNRIKNMQDLFNLPDFKQSIGCYYIRGLAAHLENRYHEANSYLSSISQYILTEKAEEEKDAYIEPVSLYFRGVLLKNMGNFDESRKCFEDALSKWPGESREVRSLVELAEVAALQTRYSDNAQTKKALSEIDQILEESRTGAGSLTRQQEANLRQMKSRLAIIEGNYAYKKALKNNKGWDKAVEHYKKAIELDSENVFANLSIGITYLKMNQHEAASEKLRDTYRMIVVSDRLVTHPEPRGRILLGGCAIIAARLSGIEDSQLRELRDPNEIQVDVKREIEELRRINIRSGREFHIFSPLTKEMETLTGVKNHINSPKDYF